MKTVGPDEAVLNADVARAAETVLSGGTLLYPTDTVWGLGCDSRSTTAVEALYALKGRPAGKAMLSLVADESWLERLTGDASLPALYRRLRAELGDGPLTLAVPGVCGLAAALTAPDGTTALRVTDDDWSRRLCLAVGVPVVSTSANVSGDPAPRFFREVAPAVLAAVDYAAQWRRDDLTPASPSAVARLEPDGRVTLLRTPAPRP